MTATPSPAEETTSPRPTIEIKTALDCDVVTLARAARRPLQASNDDAVQADPLRALYRPLGNRDVNCILGNSRR